jgi:ABC-2 type transport system permease protein
MIRPLVRIAWLSLLRDRTALGLTFVLPLVFFSVFALLFGFRGDEKGKKPAKPILILLVDLDQTDASRRLADGLARQEALTVARPAADAPLSRNEAQLRVRKGDYAAAVVIPAGWGESFARFGQEGKPVEVIYDAANPLARPTVAGLLQAAATSGMMDVLMERGFQWLDQKGGALTPQQRLLIDTMKPMVRRSGEAKQPNSPKKAASSPAVRELVQVAATPARADNGDQPKKKAFTSATYYAAGLGVMFLLFSMTGIGGTLLEEEQNGTLPRLLSSGVPMSTLLGGKWLFHMLVGVVQVTLMFLWGAAAFGLDLWTPNHLCGFAAMTLLTAASASALGILLATLCRSSAQLSGISITVILIMSALGGSMVPRPFMPKFMESLGLLTFNGWAVDGYLKVFWYDDPQASIVTTVLGLWPQMAVLGLLTVVFFLVARLLARRWEVI